MIHSKGCGPSTGSAYKHSRKGKTQVQVATEQDGDSMASLEGRPQARDGAWRCTHPMLAFAGEEGGPSRWQAGPK